MTKIVKCKKCEKLFKQTKINQRYCAECRPTVRYYIKKTPTKHICLNCKKEFDSPYSKSKFCSLRCKNIYYKIDVEKEPRTCKYRNCGKVFTTTNDNKDYCCYSHYYSEKLAREAEDRKAKKVNV